MDKKRILAVDDEGDVLTLLDRRLSAVGYEVFTTSDGRQALEIAQSHPLGSYHFGYPYAPDGRFTDCCPVES